MPDIDPRILEQARKVTAKRPKTVINHIIEYGYISTEQLKTIYGYEHPPRAARDVREAGIPLDTFNVTDNQGRRIAAYRFGDPNKIEGHKLAGRQTFSKAFKHALIAKYGERCAISGIHYPAIYLQIDHRIPYEIAGDNVAGEQNPAMFMLLSAEKQRQKSWACEQCPNRLGPKNAECCSRCYWASPENFSHIATQPTRQIDIGFQNEEIQLFDQLKKESEKAGISIQDFIKQRLRDRR